MYVQNKRFDEAIEIMNRHHFRRWEGGSGIHEEYVNVHILRGLAQLGNGNCEVAIEDFRAALRYPLNLEDGKSYFGGPESMVYYYLGTAYEEMGATGQANANFNKSVLAETPDTRQMFSFFKGLSLKMLGREVVAQKIFSSLVQFGENELTGRRTVDVFAKFSVESEESRNADAHFVLGLGLLGKGETASAKEHFQQAAEMDVNHLWTRSFLDQMKEFHR